MKQQKTTMTDVAKAAGVSQSTVSMILSGKNPSSFPTATVNRVQSVCQELNYTPKKRSRPHLSESREILILTTKITNPYYPTMIQRIEHEAMQHDLRVVACATYYQPEVEQQYLEMAYRRGFLAALFLYAPINIEAVEKYGHLISIVTVCDNTYKVPTDLVEQNDILAGQIAAKHLLSLGHRRIAYVVSNMELNYARRARFAGIQQELNSFSEPCELFLLSSDGDSVEELMGENYDYNVGYELAQRPELYSKDISAIIAVSDITALGVMDALLEKGYRIPDDFSILCFNNLFYSGLSPISLTTVDNHADLLAQSAIDLLLHRINLSETRQSLIAGSHFKIECQPQLIVRNSTCPYAPREKRS